MEEWAICQKSWLYLEPIFSSEDIMRQLPVEGKRYQTMDRMWRKIMLGAKSDPKVSQVTCYACKILIVCAVFMILLLLGDPGKGGKYLWWCICIYVIKCFSL